MYGRQLLVLHAAIFVFVSPPSGGGDKVSDIECGKKYYLKQDVSTNKQRNGWNETQCDQANYL